MIVDQEYDAALTYFENNFRDYQTTNEETFKRIIMCLVTLKYFYCLRNNDYITAYNLLNKLDQSFWNDQISLCLYDESNKIKDYTLEVKSSLKI